MEKAKLCIYDPQVRKEQVISDLRYAFTEGDNQLSESKAKLIDDHVTFASSCEEAASGAHAVAVLTEWDEFAEADFGKIYEQMKKPAFFFDGRNRLKHLGLPKAGFEYHGIGF